MTKNSNQKVALFDTDKTLIEMTGLVNRALHETTAEVFGKHGTLDDLAKDEYAGQHMRHIITLLMHKKGFEDWYIMDHMDEAMRKYVRNLVNKLDDYSQPRRLVCPGVFKFLDALQEHEIHMASFSGGISQVHNKVLKVTGLSSYFGVRCTSDNRRAPDRVQLINVCVGDLKSHTKGRVRPENIAVFGDSPNDISSANEYQAMGIGILARSLYSDKDLRAMEPFAIYKSFQDYEKILREVFKINPKKKR